MDFIFDLTISANTTKVNLTELEIDVGAGVVHLVEIGFPRGCAGLAHAVVRQGLHQVWPTNPDGDYNWDNYVYQIREHYLIEGGDAPLVLQGWNDDDTFPHTITFRFSVLPVEVMEPWRAQEGLLRRFLGAFGRKPKEGKK